MVYFYKLLFGWRVVSLALTLHLPISISVWHVLFDLDLTAHCSKLSLCVLVCFSQIKEIIQLNLLYVDCKFFLSLSVRYHLTLTSFSWFIGQC